jgi:drug/metabolite transporter (DMT)-like permease
MNSSTGARRFSKSQFLMVWLGGLAEFATSLLSIMAFNYASRHTINAGIVGVLFPLSGFFVTLGSFLMYKEKVQRVHLVGMFVLMLGATLIATFPAQGGSEGEQATTEQILILLIFSLLATMALSCELLLSKALAKRGADGRYIGFNFLLAEGILGSLCLLISTLMGTGLQELEGWASFCILVFGGGLTGVIAISVLQYSISIGVAGIVSSIFNTNVVYFTIFCFLFLD